MLIQIFLQLWLGLNTCILIAIFSMMIFSPSFWEKYSGQRTIPLIHKNIERWLVFEMLMFSLVFAIIITASSIFIPPLVVPVLLAYIVAIIPSIYCAAIDYNRMVRDRLADLIISIMITIINLGFLYAYV